MANDIIRLGQVSGPVLAKEPFHGATVDPMQFLQELLSQLQSFKAGERAEPSDGGGSLPLLPKKDGEVADTEELLAALTGSLLPFWENTMPPLKQDGTPEDLSQWLAGFFQQAESEGLKGITSLPELDTENWLKALSQTVEAKLSASGQGFEAEALAEQGLAELADGPAWKKPALSAAVEALAEPTDRLSQELDHAIEETGAEVSIASQREINPAKGPLPSIERPLGKAGWDQQLGERILWLTHKNLQAAELRLNPPQLGPLEVRIHIQQDQASIAFASQHALVREAIESAIPKLREMLNTQQLNLLDVNISQQSFSEQRERREDKLQAHSPVQVKSVGALEEKDVSRPADYAGAKVNRGLLNLYV